MAASSDRWDGSEYRANASFVYSSAYTAPVLSLLGAEPSWTVLDLGCGTGELTVELARRCTSVLAVDASPAMIESARRDLPKDLAGRLSYEIADGQALPATIDPQLHGTFDAVFSSAAIHWMKSDPPAVVKGVATMLKPGGRFAAECGGALNCVGIRAALHQALLRRGIDPTAFDPWFFPSAAHYRSLLESAGFRVDSIELVPRHNPLDTGLDGWLRTFAVAFLEAVPEDERQAVVDEVVEAMRVDCCDDNGRWSMMYMRLRWRATLQSAGAS